MRVSPTPSVVPAQSPSPFAESAHGGAQRPDRPCLTELRLSAYAMHRRAGLPIGPLTLFTGPSGSGKTSALRAYEALARLGGGASLAEAFPDPVACVPDRARPDAQHRRGFRIGCTADGPEGPVRLDVAVQAEPQLRIVGERLSSGGLVLLETALRDPTRRAVQAAFLVQHLSGLGGRQAVEPAQFQLGPPPVAEGAVQPHPGHPAVGEDVEPDGVDLADVGQPAQRHDGDGRGDDRQVVLRKLLATMPTGMPSMCAKPQTSVAP